MRRAASRAACTAGNNRATSTPIMAITTSNSTRVNPRLRRESVGKGKGCIDRYEPRPEKDVSLLEKSFPAIPSPEAYWIRVRSRQCTGEAAGVNILGMPGFFKKRRGRLRHWGSAVRG